VCFCKGIKGLFKRWNINNKGVKAKDIRAVLRHKDKVSYSNIIVKAKGFVKS
jgi:hypothetical protein